MYVPKNRTSTYYLGCLFLKKKFLNSQLDKNLNRRENKTNLLFIFFCEHEKLAKRSKWKLIEKLK